MIRDLILKNGVQPADVIIAKKRGWNVWDHYIAYIGERDGMMFFIANDMTGGVRLFNEHEVEKLIVHFEPRQVRKFMGDYWQREAALKRAAGERGKKYNLFSFNCEHLANYIQFGKRESKQTQNWLLGIAIFIGILVLLNATLKSPRK